MTKIKMCKEIIDAFIFLGIPTEKFSEYRENFGGLHNLYIFVERKISGHV